MIKMNKEKLDPTDKTEDNVNQNKKGRWKEKVYSKQLVEYANQSLREDEKQIYNTMFNEIREEHHIDKVEDFMLLDTAIYDFIRIKRIQSIIMKEGDVVHYKSRSGQLITKAHEASYLLNSIETQFRNTMKELMLTRKEVVKKQIGLGEKDFTSFLSDDVVDAEYEVKDEKKQ